MLEIFTARGWRDGEASPLSCSLRRELSGPGGSHGLARPTGAAAGVGIRYHGLNGEGVAGAGFHADAAAGSGACSPS